MKNNLPVILLRGLVLLPYNDIRLEFENDDSRNIIDLAEVFHDGNLLVVTQPDPYEINPDLNTLPNIGVVAKITHKITLPNGRVRITISGIRRSKIHEYINTSKGGLESLIGEIEPEKIDTFEEMAIVRKLYREIEVYIRDIPNMGNSIMERLSSIKKLDKFTDTLVPSLPISFERMKEYLYEELPSERARMILTDIYTEEELFDIEKNLDLKVKKQLDDNQREYVLREKLKLIKQELGEASSHEDEIDILKNRLNELNADDVIKDKIKTEINRYESLSIQSPETSMIRNYIEWLLDLPWNNYTVDNEDIIVARKILDNSHYGLKEVKDRIIEYLAVKKITHSLKSPIICLVGPPGVGKTSLAFSIAKAVNRNFVKISVGGVSDEAEILGHRRTYLGATPGRIISSMKKAKSNNPVFLIDEIDKMTHDVNGDPASALLSVLDPEQNKYFSDNYIEEDYDLSNVMFIATANYIDKIPEPLKDRLEIINLSGYTELEKVDIAKKHLLPKICKDTGLNKNIVIKDEILLYIIRHYTKEAGVRDLERKLSTIVRKLVTKVANNTFKQKDLNITTKTVESYLGKAKYKDINVTQNIGVVNGLAYTQYGGEVLPIEVNYYKGDGNLILTGSLGEVMMESAKIALSYIKANYKQFGIDYKLFDNNIHIHALEGAIPKDGPSAGIALTSAIISSLTNLKIRSDIAFTGEISLHGDVLPIGGLKEKTFGAYRNGVTTILYPYGNISDLDSIPKEIRKKISFIPVKNYMEVYQYIKG